MARTTLIRHWLPIVTLCPVNKLPDLIYITVRFDDTFAELYGVRKVLRKAAAWKMAFMEDIAETVLQQFPEATEVTVTLLFGRHVTRITRD